MHIRVGCEFSYEATWPTPTVLLVQPHPVGEHTIVREEWRLTPQLAMHAYHDIYGNLCQRLLLPQGDHTLRYDAIIEVADTWDEVSPAAPQLPVEDLPDDVLLYTLPSRFCLSDVLSDTACMNISVSSMGQACHRPRQLTFMCNVWGFAGI